MTGGTRSYEMARRFAAQGHEIHILTSWREPHENQAWFENEIDGIHIHWLPVTYSNQMSFSDRIKAFFMFAIKSAKKAAEIEADVLFATSTPLTIALPAVYAAKKQKIPMVFEIRDLWPELPIAMGVLKNPITQFLAKRLELFAYKNSASIVALSPGMKEGVVRTGYSANKVAVIPNSSDIGMFRVDPNLGYEFRAKRERLGDKPLLIYTGTFGMINGVGYMADLAAKLASLNSDICILLIGEGAEFSKVKKQAAELGVLNKNLFIEKSLPKREIPAAFSAATIASALFIDIPEMRSNSANKFFDALASSKPVLINYGGWMHNLVAAHECGLPVWQMSLDDVVIDRNCFELLYSELEKKPMQMLHPRTFDQDNKEVSSGAKILNLGSRQLKHI